MLQQMRDSTLLQTLHVRIASETSQQNTSI